MNNNIANGIVINKSQGITPQKQLDSLQDWFVINSVIVAPIYPIINGLRPIIIINIISFQNFCFHKIIYALKPTSYIAYKTTLNTSKRRDNNTFKL